MSSTHPLWISTGAVNNYRFLGICICPRALAAIGICAILASNQFRAQLVFIGHVISEEHVVHIAWGPLGVWEGDDPKIALQTAKIVAGTASTCNRWRMGRRSSSCSSSSRWWKKKKKGKQNYMSKWNVSKVEVRAFAKRAYHLEKAEDLMPLVCVDPAITTLVHLHKDQTR